MLTALKGVFRRDTNRTEEALAGDRDDIPRYPPFAKGFPSVSVERIMDSQAELISRIYYATGVSREDFNKLYQPVIRQYAGFVHLLPASELSHHRGGGGLFRHGLEVAFSAAQGSREIIFTREGSPLQKRHDKEVWQFAAFVGGLAHDAGKPLTDLAITNRQGSLTWDRVTRLSEWLEENRVDRYFIHWKENRHGKHIKENGFGLADILTVDARRYIKSASSPVMGEIQDAVHGTDMSRPLTRLVLSADMNSVSRDKRSNHINPDEHTYGVPVDAYIVDAIRRLIRDGSWKVNEVGGKVWHLEQGLFIVWHQAVKDIVALLEADQTPGVPRDPATMADVLIERGRAEAREIIDHEIEGETKNIVADRYYRYWQVTPDLLVNGDSGKAPKLLMLKMSSPEVVFTWEPPVKLTGTVVGINLTEKETEIGNEISNDKDQEEKNPRSKEQDSSGKMQVTRKPQVGDPQDDDPLGALVAVGGPMGQGLESNAEPKTSHGHVNCSQHVTKDDVRIADTNAQQGNQSKDNGEKKRNKRFITEKPGHVAQGKSSSMQKDPEDIVGKSSNKHAAKVKEIATNTSEQAAAKKTGSSGKSCDQKDNGKVEQLFEEIICAAGDAKQILKGAFEPVISGQLPLGKYVDLIDNKIVMFYPDGAKAFGNPVKVARCLQESGIIVVDPINPGKRAQEINGHKALVFVQQYSDKIRACLSELEEARIKRKGGLSKDRIVNLPEMVEQPIEKSKGDRKRREKKVKHTGQSHPTERDKEYSQLLNNVDTADENGELKQALRERPRTKRHNHSRNKVVDVSEKYQSNEAKGSGPIQLGDEEHEYADTDNVKEVKAAQKAVINSDHVHVISPESVLQQIQEQIIRRKGIWLASDVREEGGKLVTSDQIIDRALAEHTHISRREIRDVGARGAGSFKMFIRSGTVILDVGVVSQ